MQAESVSVMPQAPMSATEQMPSPIGEQVPTPTQKSAAVSKISAANSPSFLYRALERWPRWVTRLASVLLALLLWGWAVEAQWNFIINFQNVPTPLTVAHEFATQLQSSVFYTHIGVSIRRIFIAYSLAAVVGISVGILMGCFKVAEDIVAPHIEILRPIPAVAWIPLAILMMPTEESSIIFITFLGALFPIIINTVHGVEHTPMVLLRAARSLGAGRGAIMRHVVLPCALPNIATGLAVGMGVSWFSLLAGEIISGQYGIGYFTWSAYTLVAYPQIIVGMLVIGGLGALSTALVRLLTRPFLRWQGEQGVK